MPALYQYRTFPCPSDGLLWSPNFLDDRGFPAAAAFAERVIAPTLWWCEVSALESALNIVGWLELLNPPREGFALSRARERLTVQRCGFALFQILATTNRSAGIAVHEQGGH
jgi:hypothetical protein